MEHIIKILDDGNNRYLLSPKTIILGRQYDDLADKIVIERPLAEQESACLMSITDINGKPIDTIVFTDNSYTIRNNVSKYRNVKIGFRFIRADGYNKGSEIITAQFLPAPNPENFIEIEPMQKKNVEYLIQYGFVGSKLVGNELQFFNSNGDKVVSFDFSPFTQEQVDLGETNEEGETFVKGKLLSNLENDMGFITKSTLSLENYYGKNETYTREEVKSEIEQKIATLTATQVRNKAPNLVIETTDNDLQTTATNYIVTNYSRQPQEYDGLYLTLTDHSNQVVQFSYHNNAWVNMGFDKVDLSNYMDLTSEQRVGGRKIFENETVFESRTEFEDDIMLNDSSVKTTDTTNDLVTIYSADGIRQESGSNGTTKDFEFPNNSGKLALKDECVKAQTCETGVVKVYCISGSNPHDVCRVDSTGLGLAMVRYNSNGLIAVRNDPQTDNDVTRKSYVDNLFQTTLDNIPEPVENKVYRHKITLAIGQSNYLMFVFFSNSGTSLTLSSFLPTEQTSKYMDLSARRQTNDTTTGNGVIGHIGNLGTNYIEFIKYDGTKETITVGTGVTLSDIVIEL